VSNNLFIGGSQDGKWIDVENERPFVQFAIRDQPAMVSFRQSEAKPTMPMIECEVYERHEFRGETGHFHYYSAEGLSADQVITKLFNGYRPQEETK